MSKVHPTASHLAGSTQQTSDSAGASEFANRRFHKTRKVIRFISGVDVLKKQAGIVKHRASFPLLRKVVANELSQSRTILDLRNLSTPILKRSLKSHYLMLMFTIPACIWALFSIAKGLGAGIKFDAWLTGWLIQGIPVFMFCFVKALMSNKSRMLIQSELATRKLGNE